MTQRRDLDPELIARFLSGESAPAESALVRAWATDPRGRAEWEALQRAWTQLQPVERSIDVDAAWRKVATAMQAEGHPHVQEEPNRSHVVPTVSNLRLHSPLPSEQGRHLHALRPTLNRVSARSHAMRLATFAAAAAVLVVAAAGTVRVLGGTWPLATAAKTRTAPPERTTQDYSSGPGQRALIDLADGTHIVLSPESRLHVSLPTGATGQRELTLDGQALFTVTHDAARPFLVHTRYGTTLDLGTAFAVRAYAEQTYRVVVRDGQVALGAEVGAPLLKAGDVASAAQDGTMHVTHEPDAAALLDWATGRLTFQHTRLIDLVPELERWYGVTIRIATPSLRNRRITGQLDTESRAEAMAAIGRTLGAQHTVHGARVTFSIRGDGR